MARERSIGAGFSILGADAARQELKKLQEAAEAFGDSGTKAAKLLTDGFAGVEKGTDRLWQKLSQGKEIASRDLQPLIDQYGALEVTAVRAFGSLENAPEEVRAALQRSEAQIRSVSEASEKMAADIARATGKFKDLSGEASEMAGRFKRIEESFEAFEEAVASGSPEIGEKLGRVMMQQIQLRKEIERTEAAGEQLAPEMVAAYAKIEQRVERAKNNVRELTVELQKQRGEVAAAGATWGGLDQAFTQLGGNMGKFAAQGAVALVALREIGGLIKTVEENASSAGNGIESASEAAVIALGKIKDRLVEGQREAAKFVGEFLTIDETEDPLAELAQGLQRVAIAGNLGREGVHKFNVALEAGLSALERQKLAQNEAAQAAIFHDRALRLGDAGQKLWARAVEQSGKTAAGLEKAVAALTDELKTAESQWKRETEEKLKSEEASKRVMAAINAERDAVEKRTIAQRIANTEQTRATEEAIAAKEVVNGLSAEMASMLASVQRLAPAHEQNGVALNDYATKMQASLDTTAGYTAAQRAAIQALIDYTKELANAAANVTILGQVEEEAKAKVEGLDEAVKKQNSSLEMMESAYTAASEKVKALTEQYGETSIFVKQAREEEEHYAEQLEATRRRLEETTEELGRAKAATSEQAIATEAARRQAEQHGAMVSTLTGNTASATEKFSAFSDGLRSMLRPFADLGKEAPTVALELTNSATAADKVSKAIVTLNSSDLSGIIGSVDKLSSALDTATSKVNTLSRAASAVGSDEAPSDGISITDADGKPLTSLDPNVLRKKG